MLEEATASVIKQHVAAIGLSFANGLHTPALILTYVGIDAFGALGRPVGADRNLRGDFVEWADRYMVQPARLPATGLELYGARCGLLHDLSAESRLSRSGKIRSIMYGWGNSDIAEAQTIVAKAKAINSKLDAVFVKVEDITDAFVKGIALFGEDVDLSPESYQQEVNKRAHKMFGNFGSFPGL